MRREPLLAGLLCVAGAFLVLVAAGRAWVVVDVVGTPLVPEQALAVVGSDLSPGLRALGLAGLAGVLAVAATRGRGRPAIGVLLLGVGAGVAAIVLRLAMIGFAEATRRTDVVQQSGADVEGSTVQAWPWVCLAGGVLLALAGLLVAVRGRRWAALGRRYEPPAPREVEGPVAERELWEALDRGEDPTGAPPDPADSPAEGRG